MRLWDGVTPLGDLPARAAQRYADCTALVFESQRYTFAQLEGDIAKTAKALLAAGVKPGDKCIVWLMNSPEWIHLMFAIARVGAVLVPANTRLRTDDFAFILGQSEAAWVFTHDRSGPVDYLSMVREVLNGGAQGAITLPCTAYPELRGVVLLSEQPLAGTTAWPSFLADGNSVDEAELEARAASVRVEDTLFIMYTSGTTGFPKGVMRSHGLIASECDRIAFLGTTQHDVVVNYLPLFHIFGYVDGPLSSVLAGNCQVLMSSFDPREALELIEQERATQTQGFEAHLTELVRVQKTLGADLSSLRCGLFAAGMQSGVEIVREAWEVLAPFHTITGYGMTEIGANCAMGRQDSTLEQAAESSGLPSPGYAFRVVDPASGAEQPTGTPGELWVKTDNLMQGYYREPELTREALSADGWFKTGDMGYMREDGYFRFVGRYKDMLKIGGENVDPMEVERHLLRHPAVLEAAVVGFPDARLTEIAVAFVRVADGQGLDSGEALADWCRGRLASFKVPRHVFLVDALPMTSTGKVRKVELRAQALGLLSAAPEPRSA